MLNIEEQVYRNAFKDKAKEYVYENLYKQQSKRIVTLVKTLKRELENNGGVQYAQIELINSYKERIRTLQNKYTALQTEFNDLKIELEDKSDMYGKLQESAKELLFKLETYKGSEKLLKALKLDQLKLVEEDCQKTLRIIAKEKNDVNQQPWN